MLGPFEVSAPFVIYLEGHHDLVLLLALREPRVRALSPPRSGMRDGEVRSSCGRVTYSYRLEAPMGLSISGLDVYADVTAAVSVALLARRACGGSTSLSDAVLGSGLQGLEALSYAVSLGGVVLARRTGTATRFIGRWQAAPWLRVILGGGGGERRIDALDLLTRIVGPGGASGTLCRCTEPRLRLGVELRAGVGEEGGCFETSVDNLGAVARLYEERG